MFHRTMMLAMVVLLKVASALAQDTPTASPNKHLPTLAVTVSAEQAGGQNGENLEDLLMIELANQPFLQIVDRQKLQDVLKEHAIALGNKPGAKEAVALGKFAGADYLLHVLAEKEKKTAAIRLVAVASGQVKLEGQVALTDDLALSAAAIREKVLAAVRPESQAANRLTVGIAAFPNRSGTDRSDKLGIELQKALRKRLNDQSWAIVLERQYPTSLLEEVDLARTGLVRDNAAEKLPPADLVILGTLEDADKEYEPGKSWSVKLDLTLRLRDNSNQIIETCRSDAIEAAADHVMEKIDEFRQQPASHTTVPEKELWRRQALYLMPNTCESTSIGPVPNFCYSSAVTKIETIRAWENVLLLDGNDAEAMTYLGFCQIGFNCWPAFHDTAAAARCVAGSYLVERAFRNNPSPGRADTLISCIEAIRRVAPARAKEMAEYIVDHRERFEHADHHYVKSALVQPASELNDGRDASGTGWNRAIQRAQSDPDTLLLSMHRVLRGERSYEPHPASLELNAAILAQYMDSPDSVVQFVVHAIMGQMLCCKKNDPAGLEHFTKAIDLLEKVTERCPTYGIYLNKVYQLRIEACQLLGRPEEAKETGLAGTRHFMKGAHFDESIAWLYHYCVTEALGEGQEKEALTICDAYLAAAGKTYMVSWEPGPRITAVREELLARLASKPIPDLSSLRLVKGTGPQLSMRMAATKNNVWLVSRQPSGYAASFGRALRCGRGSEDAVDVLPGVLLGANCVAAAKDYVFINGPGGLYKLDVNGTLLKHYDRKSGALPGNGIADLCVVRDKIYFAYGGNPRGGIAILDPVSDKISVLIPSGRDANAATEPRLISWLRWDTANSRLYACFSTYPCNQYSWMTCEHVWTQENNVWQRIFAGGGVRPENAAQLVVSQGDETVIVRDSGDQAEFQFQKTGQKVRAAVPSWLLMGEPAWDEHRLWAPTPSGLYEIDCATGKVTWLAHEHDTPFLSLLKHGERLYAATGRGLYCYDIPAYAP